MSNRFIGRMTRIIFALPPVSTIIHKPLPSDDPTQRKPVIELAKKELDWEPTIMLDEGLERTIEYFKTVV